jgi:hypothetical protein
VTPKSRRRNESSRRYKPAPPKKRSRSGSRRRVGWGLAVVGGLLFVIGNVGARTSIVLLPFDPHHIIAQVGGAILGVVGLIIATTR